MSILSDAALASVPVDEILRDHPDLHYGGYGGSHSDRDSRELRAEESVELITRVAATFRYFPPGPRELRTRTSYGFKHDAERHLQGYVSNGQAIAAFLSLGYRLAGDGGYNAAFFYPGCACEDEACGLCAERVISCDCEDAVCDVCDDNGCPDAVCPRCKAGQEARVYPGCAACESHESDSSWDSSAKVQEYRERWERAERALSPAALAYARAWEKRFARDPRYAEYLLTRDLVARLRKRGVMKQRGDRYRSAEWRESAAIMDALGAKAGTLWAMELEAR